MEFSFSTNLVFLFPTRKISDNRCCLIYLA